MLLWRYICHVQFLVMLGLYIWLGLTPSPELYVPIFNDKLMHFSGYFVAAFSISFAYPHQRALLKASFLILFSICIEIGQHFMPPRTFDVLDICANSVGVLVGLTCVYLLTRNAPWFKQFLFLGSD